MFGLGADVCVWATSSELLLAACCCMGGGGGGAAAAASRISNWSWVMCDTSDGDKILIDRTQFTNSLYSTHHRATIRCVFFQQNRKTKRPLFIHYQTHNQKLKQTEKTIKPRTKAQTNWKTKPQKTSRKTNLDGVSRTITSESTRILHHPA